MATDKTRYKDVKVRIPEEELAVLNCRVAKTGMSREQYIRCLIADTIPAEYPPADYRLTCKIAELRKEDKIAEGAIKRIQRTCESNRIDQENQYTNNKNRRRNRSRQR